MKTVSKYLTASIGFFIFFMIMALMWIAEINYQQALEAVEKSGAVTDGDILEVMQQYGFKDMEAVNHTTGWERMKAIFN